MVTAMVIFACGSALAQCNDCNFNAQGGTTVPGFLYYYTNSNTFSLAYITLTNTSSNTICCRVNTYGSDGEDLTSWSVVKKGGVEWTTVLTGAGSFEIPPHETRCYIAHLPSSRYHTYAHATVQWKSSDPLQKNALIGSCTLRNSNNGVMTTSYIPVNNGNPF